MSIQIEEKELDELESIVNKGKAIADQVKDAQEKKKFAREKFKEAIISSRQIKKMRPTMEKIAEGYFMGLQSRFEEKLDENEKKRYKRSQNRLKECERTYTEAREMMEFFRESICYKRGFIDGYNFYYDYEMSGSRGPAEG